MANEKSYTVANSTDWSITRLDIKTHALQFTNISFGLYQNKNVGFFFFFAVSFLFCDNQGTWRESALKKSVTTKRPERFSNRTIKRYKQSSVVQIVDV